ncbi:MAG: 4Fe-4S dicluster domain-containing protein [Gammaproteobacteria bacterium]
MSTPAFTLPASFVEQYGEDLYHCASCNYCVDAVWAERGIAHVCATLEHHSPAPGYSGRGFIDIARALHEGRPLAVEAVAERVFTCTGCGNCETLCPIGLHPAAIGQSLREALTAAERLPEPVERARRGALERGEHRRESAFEQSPVTGGTTLSVFAGCSASSEARALAGWLADVGIDVDWRGGPERCCGAVLGALGDARRGRAWAAATAAELAGDEPTVVLGYECLASLGAAAAETLSLPAWLIARIDAGRITLRARAGAAARDVYLFESCQLKPRPGVPAPPDERDVRALLERLGIRMLNDRYPNVHVLCCGAGGALPAMQPEAALSMARGRVAGLAGAPVVALDPRCAAYVEAASPDTPVAGLVEFLARTFELRAEDAA